MKPLATAQRILSWFCIRPFDEPSTWKEIARVIFVVFLPISVFSCEVLSVLFFAKYISTDLNGSIFALLQIAIYFGLFYTMVAVAYSRRDLLAIFDSLAKIYDACKNFPVHFFGLSIAVAFHFKVFHINAINKQQTESKKCSDYFR